MASWRFWETPAINHKQLVISQSSMNMQLICGCKEFKIWAIQEPLQLELWSYGATTWSCYTTRPFLTWVRCVQTGETGVTGVLITDFIKTVQVYLCTGYWCPTVYIGHRDTTCNTSSLPHTFNSYFYNLDVYVYIPGKQPSGQYETWMLISV
jgi:hypothetical protein